MNRDRMIHRNGLVARANRRAHIGLAALLALGFLAWLFGNDPNYPHRWRVPNTHRTPGGRDG